MAEQIKKFKPKMVSISDGDDIQKLKDLIKDMDGDMPEILYGADGKDQRNLIFKKLPLLFCFLFLTPCVSSMSYTNLRPIVTVRTTRRRSYAP